MVLAARGSAWGGMVIGLVAAGLFVLFSTYILVQRLRSHRQAQPTGKGHGADD